MKADVGRGTQPGSSYQNARRVARISLGVMTGLLAFFVMMGPSFGSISVLAQASPSNTTSSPTASSSASSSATPTPTPTSTTPATPSVAFLNPSQDYDPGLPLPPRGPDASDPPKVSDRFDGVDSAYHVSVWVGASAPTTRVLELYIQYGTNNEQTIGLMDEVAGVPNTYEYYWDIPDSFAEGAATMRVRMYAPNAEGDLEEVANDEVAVDMQHRDTIQPSGDNTSPSDETIELTFPTQNGIAGFYKGRGGTWKGMIDGTASSFSSEMDLLYTVSQPGQEVDYKLCGSTTLYNKAGYGTGPIAWSATCTLESADTPSEVTAIAAVVLDADRPNRLDSAASRDELTQDSADVHRVNAYAQTPDLMTIDLDPEITSQTPDFARALTGRCIAYLITVKDQFDRPVNGANVDVHIEGPNDQMQFGDENNPTNGPVSSGYKNPDKGTHTSEGARDCDGTFPIQGTQGEQNIAGAPDIKHRESTTGTSASGTWRFHLISMTAPGLTEITAWIDDEDLAVESDNRPLDTDVLEAGEQQDSFVTQWYGAAPTLKFQPTGGSSVTGECFSYTLRARSGSAPIAGINVDIHARGPNDDLDFCDPVDASERRAPDKPVSPDTPHTGEDTGEASHTGDSPKTQHTEGETNDSGNFVFGLTSPVAGDTFITAWIDKEPGYDNDIQDGGELSASATHTWGATLENATVRFVNPSGYGGGAGDSISTARDADTTFHLVARTDAPDLVPGIEFYYSSNGTTFTLIGSGTRVGSTDTFEMNWNVGTLADGDYTLRTQITGTSKVEDRTVTVAKANDSVEITKPLNGTNVAFTKRATTVSGTATGATEIVEVFYTTTSAGTSRDADDWTLCGSQSLAVGTAPKAFSTTCTLAASDQGNLVTGIAAIAKTCDMVFGCEGDTPLGAETYASGDAHRIFGYDTDPVISIEPAEAEETKGECQRFTLRVVDQTGQAIAQQNVDVHLTGPTDDAAFCDPGDASPRSNPDGGSHSVDPDDGATGVHEDATTSDTMHTEATTTNGGRFVFGITSPEEGDSTLIGWVDQTENDALDSDERSDTSLMHWVSEVGPVEDRCTIRGTQGDDAIEGTSGDDVICGMGGNDVIRAKAGADLVRGGYGADTVRGGSGSDTLRGRQGSDRLFGGIGADGIQGGRGRDRIDGGSGQDSCVGGPGRDRVARCE